MKYLYINYMTDGPRDFKMIHETENYGKLKSVVLRVLCSGF
jgi:hypothetical protein